MGIHSATFFCISLLVTVVACKGKLTNRQRNTMKGIIKSYEIQKIPEAEIIEKSFSYGRHLYQSLESLGNKANRYKLMDAFYAHHNIRFVLLHPEDSSSLLEKEILIAYEAVNHSNGFHDNVQYLPDKSVLYTMPITKKELDGTIAFDYVLGIYIPSKEIVSYINRTSPKK